MRILYILAVLVFSIVLCIIEVPKMQRQKLYRELWTFSILLGLGMVLTILKSLNVQIPNPSDLIAWFYSPFTGFIKSILK